MTNNSDKTPAIIVCIDTNNPSESALLYACHKAQTSGFNVHLLTIIESSHKNLMFGAKAFSADNKKIVKQNLRDLIEKASKKTGIMPTITVGEGDVVNGIIKKIKEIPNCAMIIFGKSNNSLSDNIVISKVAQKISNKLNIPITIVPQNLTSDFLENLCK